MEETIERVLHKFFKGKVPSQCECAYLLNVYLFQHWFLSGLFVRLYSHPLHHCAHCSECLVEGELMHLGIISGAHAEGSRRRWNRIGVEPEEQEGRKQGDRRWRRGRSRPAPKSSPQKRRKDVWVPSLFPATHSLVCSIIYCIVLWIAGALVAGVLFVADLILLRITWHDC
jgi:hypothetical protein